MFGETMVIPAPDHEVIPFLIPFGIIGVWRWGLFLLRVIFRWLYCPITPRRHGDGSSANKYKPSDVTIIVPTIDNGEEFLEAARNWQKNKPRQIIIVTSDTMKHEIQKTCEQAMDDPSLFRVLSVPNPNKRVQLMKGVYAAETVIVALSDDDAIWTTSDFLQWMLAPFDDDNMGGVGSKQAMMPTGRFPTVWEVIADFRLTMRMIETSATTFVDGGMSCLSGRTAVYRTEILQDPNFEREFVNEKWLGKYALHSGDDKFITRWLVKNNWKMQMQNHKDATLLTTFKPDRMFIKQVLRWTRNTWRSDMRSVFVDKKIWWRHPYVCFNMWDKFLNPLPLLFGVALIIWNTATFGGSVFGQTLVPVFAWLMFTRMLKLIPHLLAKPSHIVFVPAMIFFQYFFAVMKLYALFTLHITDWGSRDGADGEESSDASSSNEDTEELSFCTATQFLEMDLEAHSAHENESKAVPTTSVKQHGSKPWYKRFDGWIGAMLLLCTVGAVGYLAHLVIKPRWTMTLIATNKALSSDRATGAAFHDPASGKTFVAYAGPNMDPTVKEFDHVSTALASNSIAVGSSKPTSDYHDYPMMNIDNDGKLMVVFTDSPETLHMSKASEPHTTNTTWTETQINSDSPTYPCIIKASNGNMYIFYRRTVKDMSFYSFLTFVQRDYRPLVYIKSTDNGETWSKPRSAVDTGGLQVNGDLMNLNEIYADCPRYEPAQAGLPERFAMGWTLAGGGPTKHEHNFYHKNAYFAYFYPATDDFVSASGANLGSAIEYDDLELCLVLDSGPLDMTDPKAVDYYFAPSFVDDNHFPIVTYNFNRTLKSATWTGEEWSHSVIAEDAALSGFDIQKTGPDQFRIFLPEGSIKIYESSNAGASWSLEDNIKPNEDGASVNKVIMIGNTQPESDMQFLAYENNWDEQNYNGTYRIWSVGLQ
ncbi:Glycosyl transferase family 2 [Seminavis robusta]|uniref:Glycosyl transferase family 2 n=1 Tax=Seminavis robusta TaxID=568900 RepID=A0A9N8EFS8_9STRA|nr:Glycosyl transferase family 2 [Seminavis robusta]|eukprot:Sro1059_g236540.1 Glycosyl transferase family 2 (929) ;mRNA; r:20214-23167